MNPFKTLIIVLCCLSATVLPAQKQLIKKANNFYKLNKYKDAIALYEEALQKKENLGASTKLAYCFRMTNQMDKAEEWYTKVVAEEKAKPITYFYYAESLMSNGKYDLAKNWFLKYNEKVPDDKNAVRMAYACDKVKTLIPYFQHVEIKDFEHNSEVDDASPLFLNNGIVFTSDREQGMNPLKQKSGWTGRDYQRIYFSAQQTNGGYDAPVNFSKKLNDINKHCGPVSFTKDQKTVIFSRTSQQLGKNKTYNIQLYSAESEDGRKWKKVEVLSFCNKEYNYMHPAISPDGSTLYFISDKPRGIGGTDIYKSKKEGDKWGKPVNLGPIINTSSNEAFPFFHESGKLFFCSKGHLSFGGFDILFSHLKENGTWQKPVNVGQPINSSYDDISIYIDGSLKSGMFASSRNGGDDDVYIFNVLEGVNTELDTLDFEGLTTDEIKKELFDEKPKPTSAESPAPSELVTNSEMKKETPEIGEKKIIHPDKETSGLSEAVVETIMTEPPKEEFKKEEKRETILPENEEPVIRSIAREESMPDRKGEIRVEQTEKVVMEKTENLTPTVEKPKLSKVVVTPEESSAQTKTKKSKKKSKTVNLIIPKKKKKNNKPEPKVTEVIESTKKESNINLVIKNNENANKEINTKSTESPVIESTVIKEENTSESPEILDTEVIQNKPPVLIGDQSSMLSKEVLKLPKLAELLKNNEAIPSKGFLIEGLEYPKGSYLLSTKGTRSLAAVIDLMEMNPDLKVEIGSHTSAKGDDVDNHNLSRKRAMSIRAFLMYKGISNDRITAKGYGETELLNNCVNGVKCSKAEHLKNDRVELKVVN